MQIPELLTIEKSCSPNLKIRKAMYTLPKLFQRSLLLQCLNISIIFQSAELGVIKYQMHLDDVWRVFCGTAG